MTLSEQALHIWHAAVAAVKPESHVQAALAEPGLAAALRSARHILVFGAGKAGAAMSAAVESALADQLDKLSGWVNVPADAVRPLSKIHLHAARPTGSNHPTAEGVAGAEEILRLAQGAGPDDVGLCLLSGGGSALLPAPAAGVTLADKQAVTNLLHACGATINEMNAVRKHLSAVKGGRLAQAFRGRALTTLIISDVIGDPLDVIASGPTAADPTTFADALAVLDRHGLRTRAPQAVVAFLERGAAGGHPETPKTMPAHVQHLILGNNAKALTAAEAHAQALGFNVVNLGSYLEGETREAAVVLAGVVRAIRQQGVPEPAPACLLSGGETTVTLSPHPGRGGRNQEFVLAALAYLGLEGMKNVVVLSGGTDGEDGPTNAAGAFADDRTLATAARLGLAPGTFLDANNAYDFFAATNGLIKTGLTDTNVMDVRVMLVG